MNNKKITIFYSDDQLYHNDKKLIPMGKNTRTVYTTDDYIGVRVSERIKWVEEMVKSALKRKTMTAVFTNDYWFMRLIEHFCPQEEFCINCIDDDKIVDRFVDIPNNHTLKVGEFIFRCSVREALKEG